MTETDRSETSHSIWGGAVPPPCPSHCGDVTQVAEVSTNKTSRGTAGVIGSACGPPPPPALHEERLLCRLLKEENSSEVCLICRWFTHVWAVQNKTNHLEFIYSLCTHETTNTDCVRTYDIISHTLLRTHRRGRWCVH